MRRGSLWRKCDFQIHTPRDRNWNGPRPPGVGDGIGDGKKATIGDCEASRSRWADDFVEACVDRGLKAIAITDHHEMQMVRYVRAKLIEKDLDIWLFPGMELTLNLGVQCLILFDEGLDDPWWLQAQGALGIRHADVHFHSAAQDSVIQLSLDYPNICNALDTHQALRGRYIVLPNVSQGGQHTVLRDGWHASFKDMPYVGGYLDSGQSINNLSSRCLARLSGEAPQWGSRSIYPIATSDSREHSYQRLGTNNTWIKLSAPTAESLRQAFLAYKSRLRIGPPEIPRARVESMAVSGAKPLADTEILFNPEYNCIIGGRGCGKSTMLEYLAFGLGRSCYDLAEKVYSGTQRLVALISRHRYLGER